MCCENLVQWRILNYTIEVIYPQVKKVLLLIITSSFESKKLICLYISSFWEFILVQIKCFVLLNLTTCQQQARDNLSPETVMYKIKTTQMRWQLNCFIIEPKHTQLKKQWQQLKTTWIKINSSKNPRTWIHNLQLEFGHGSPCMGLRLQFWLPACLSASLTRQPPLSWI